MTNARLDPGLAPDQGPTADTDVDVTLALDLVHAQVLEAVLIDATATGGEVGRGLPTGGADQFHQSVDGHPHPMDVHTRCSARYRNVSPLLVGIIRVFNPFKAPFEL